MRYLNNVVQQVLDQQALGNPAPSITANAPKPSAQRVLINSVPMVRVCVDIPESSVGLLLANDIDEMMRKLEPVRPQLLHIYTEVQNELKKGY